MCWLSRKCSPATWVDVDSQQWSCQIYVLFWLAGLSAILAFGPATGWPRFVMLGIVLYRLQELTFATLDNAFKLTKRARRPELDAYKWPTPLLLALVSIIQIVLIFAIAYLILIGRNTAAFANPPSRPFDAFFLSWISLPPAWRRCHPPKHNGKSPDDQRRGNRPTAGRHRHRPLPSRAGLRRLRSSGRWNTSAARRERDPHASARPAAPHRTSSLSGMLADGFHLHVSRSERLPGCP